MSYQAQIIADSVAENGKRLTTMQVTFPRFILAEVNTHRQLSRNSASSRAIPIEKRIAEVLTNPFVPETFTKNKRGMQGGDPLEGVEAEDARSEWLNASRQACKSAAALAKLGIHKQYANRLLEPFLWHTAVISATEWSNLYAQRCHPDAQPEFRIIAEMMENIQNDSVPKLIRADDPIPWHLPYITQNELELWMIGELTEIALVRISVARCARVSFYSLNADGTWNTQLDPHKDLELYTKLRNGTHMSPFEHVATPLPYDQFFILWSGNFFGWKQYRKMIPGECR